MTALPGTRAGLVPDAIVIRTVAADAPDATRRARRQVRRASTGLHGVHHLVVLDGTVTHHVDDGDAAGDLWPTPASSWPLLRPGIDPGLHTIGVAFAVAGGGAPRDEAYEAGASLLATVALRWDIPIDAVHVVDHGHILGPPRRPSDVDVDRLLSAARDAARPWESISDDPGQDSDLHAAMDVSSDAGPPVVGLIAVRNDPHGELVAALDSLAAVSDEVIALDDGSTDDTVDTLRRHGAVRTILRNPTRPGFAGWHDGANRNRLLRRAIHRGAGWVLFLDADETLTAADAACLTAAIGDELDPAVAYGMGLRHHWLGEPVGEIDVVHRLFAPRVGDVVSMRRLHGTPIPARFEPGDRAHLDVVIDHTGGSDPARLDELRTKYRQNDPEDEYGSSHVLARLHDPSDE